MNKSLSPFLEFNRRDWAKLRADTPLTLEEEDLRRLRGINVDLSIEEVETIFLPLSRLLNLYIGASQNLYGATSAFLGHHNRRVPYIIGLAGSVAVGKSTTSRILRELLAYWPEHMSVALVTTDGFLYPNAELERRSLMHRKGFPETYDIAKILEFVFTLKSGQANIKVPIYSHLQYDILPNEFVTLKQPDVVIIEGLTVLQTGDPGLDVDKPRVFVSDFFDFQIFVDAETKNIRRWYIERFLKLRDTAFKDPTSYFHRYAHLNDIETTTLADSIWSNINKINLIENILPTRERADLILRKDKNHHVKKVRLRKI